MMFKVRNLFTIPGLPEPRKFRSIPKCKGVGVRAQRHLEQVKFLDLITYEIRNTAGITYHIRELNMRIILTDLHKILDIGSDEAKSFIEQAQKSASNPSDITNNFFLKRL